MRVPGPLGRPAAQPDHPPPHCAAPPPGPALPLPGAHDPMPVLRPQGQGCWHAPGPQPIADALGCHVCMVATSADRAAVRAAQRNAAARQLGPTLPAAWPLPSAKGFLVTMHAPQLRPGPPRGAASPLASNKRASPWTRAAGDADPALLHRVHACRTATSPGRVAVRGSSSACGPQHPLSPCQLRGPPRVAELALAG